MLLRVCKRNAQGHRWQRLGKPDSDLVRSLETEEASWELGEGFWADLAPRSLGRLGKVFRASLKPAEQLLSYTLPPATPSFPQSVPGIAWPWASPLIPLLNLQAEPNLQTSLINEAINESAFFPSSFLCSFSSVVGEENRFSASGSRVRPSHFHSKHPFGQVTIWFLKLSIRSMED